MHFHSALCILPVVLLWRPFMERIECAHDGLMALGHHAILVENA